MDALLIPAFIFFLALGPVVAVALLLYAFPVRIASGLLRNETVQSYTMVVSWAGLGIRTTASSSGSVTEVLIGRFSLISHKGSAGSAVGKRKGHPSGKTMPDQEATPGDVPAQPGLSSDTARTLSPLNPGRMIPLILRRAGSVSSFGSAFWKASRFVDARGKVTLGLGDPVLTGEICGTYWASRFLLQASRVYLDLEPVFDREVLGLDITVRFIVNHPLLVLIAAIRLARDPVVKGKDSRPGRRAGAATV
jgi:hypothetical protein